jgi:hypothetical protein
MLTAGFAAAGAGFSGLALASSGGSTGSAVISGLGSLVGGNQVSAPIRLPVDVCGDAASVLGIGLAGCGGGASASSASAGSIPSGGTAGTAGSTTGGGSAAGGDQAGAPAAAAGPQRGGTSSGTPGSATSGDRSAAGGNQISVPGSGPASMCGDTAAVLGDSAAGCEGTAGATTGSAGGRTFADTPETGTAPSRAGADGLARGAAAPTRATGAGGDQAVPATTLAADSPSGMSSISIYSLAIGALVAGAVALKMATRRLRGQRRGHRV